MPPVAEWLADEMEAGDCCLADENIMVGAWLQHQVERVQQQFGIVCSGDLDKTVRVN